MDLVVPVPKCHVGNSSKAVGRKESSRHLNEKNEQCQKCFVANMKFTQDEIAVWNSLCSPGEWFYFITPFTKKFLILISVALQGVTNWIWGINKYQNYAKFCSSGKSVTAKLCFASSYSKDYMKSECNEMDKVN